MRKFPLNAATASRNMWLLSVHAILCECLASHKSLFFTMLKTTLLSSWRKRLCRWMPASFNTLSLLWINATEFNPKDLRRTSCCEQQMPFFCCYRFIIIWFVCVCCYANNANAFLFCVGLKATSKHFFLGDIACTKHTYTRTKCYNIMCRVFCANFHSFLLLLWNHYHNRVCI